MAETVSVSGFVERIVFRNEENGYTVLALKPKKGGELTCVGSFPEISSGACLKIQGEYVNHALYGKQLQIHSYEETLPQDADALERYLGSGAIKGVRAALASKIVKEFGEDTLRILEEEPEKLSRIKGISLKKAREIGQQAAEKTNQRRAMIFLQKYGISLNLGVRIYQRYGQEVYRILEENPYRMAEDIQGVGFVTADEIASRIGIHVDSDYRIRSGLLYLLSMAQAEGHCFLPKQDLFGRASRLLGVDPSYMEKHLMDLALDRKLVAKSLGGETRVYPSRLFALETDTARLLSRLQASAPPAPAYVEKRLAGIAKETGLVLDEMQRQAILASTRSGIFILTGGPGTGKTTTLNALIRYYEGEGCQIELAAPTGRAAKRMAEASGRDARTIHRLLELSGGVTDESGQDLPAHFERNADNPLEADVIVIDEMSMVDISLMHALLEAVPDTARLVLVGDENQLPSVGPGNVLKDLIASGVFPVVELKRIFRQARESDIVVNAHRILQGHPAKLDNQSRDFFFLRRTEPAQILRVLITLVREKLPPYVEAKPYDIQVLTPMRKGVLGVENLNLVLQRFLNPPAPDKEEQEIGNILFREGDKVMQIRNNYQLAWEIRGRKGVVAEEGVGVFNGDMGTLRKIHAYTQEATVEFEENRFVRYSFRQMEELELAYAITVHKSQGSEYPAVVIPLLGGPALLMNRNLLYTAVTRARRCVTLVGSDASFNQMVLNEQQKKRYSSLGEALQALISPKPDPAQEGERLENHK